MIDDSVLSDLLDRIQTYPKASLALLPTPLHPIQNFGAHLGGPELWIKRDDLTGLEGGGNKTRKLEYLVGDAIASGADMLVTVGAIQSNHTRQTAAAAAKAGLKGGDVIVGCGGKDVKAPADLGAVLRGLEAGAKVAMVVLRGEERLTIEVTLGVHPRVALAQPDTSPGMKKVPIRMMLV